MKNTPSETMVDEEMKKQHLGPSGACLMFGDVFLPLIHYQNMSGAIIYKPTKCAVQCHKPARF
jgi:hypothetical protein